MIARLIRHYRENPLAAKLLSLILVGSSIVTLLGIGFQLNSLYRSGLEGIKERIEGVRITVAPGMGSALWNFDMAQVELQLKSITQLDNVVAARVSYDSPLETTHLQVSREGASLADVTEWRTLPLEHEGSVIGQLELGVSDLALMQQVRHQALTIAIVQTAKTFVVSLMILWLVEYLYTRHLNHIARTTQQLRLGNLGTPVQLQRRPQRTRDELDKLVDALNAMRERILSDMTAREAADAALAHEREQLREARQRQREQSIEARIKSEMLATISHEIRTPMNGVIGMVQLLRATPLNPEQRNQLSVIESCGETLLCVINDVLDFSKLTAGKLELDPLPFDVDQLLHVSAQLFRERLAEKHIALTAVASPALPRVLEADERRIQQILFNLIGNAIKFTADGEIHVQMEGAALPDGDYSLQLNVEDTGMGVPPELHPRLFQPFTQADRKTATRFGGTGLGLAICRQIARLMDGDVWLDTQYTGGARFCVRLKVRLPAQLPAELPPPPLAGTDFLLATPPGLSVVGLCAERLGARVEQVALPLARQPAPGSIVCLDARHPDTPALSQALEAAGARVLLASDDPGAGGSRQLLLPPFTSIGLAQALECGPISATESAPLAIFPRHRVLAVDDNATNRLVLQQMLRKLGVQVTTASSGEEALEQLDANPELFDLVLMDVEMPGLDGYDTTREIRRREAAGGRAHLPVVAVSAHALAEATQQAMESGMDHYLTKPVRLHELSQLLQGIPARTAAAAQTATSAG